MRACPDQALRRSGQIVGWSQTKGHKNRVFLWENGRMTDLGTLGGRESDLDYLDADTQTINNQGEIIG